MRLSILACLLLIIGTQAAKADKVMVLDQAMESMQARVDILRRAQKTIDVQYFTVEHDQLSVAGLALIKDAARRGVKVRIIVDSMHNLMTRELMSAFLDNLSPQAVQNIEIREFNQFSLLNPFCYTRRMHDKSLIVDNEFLIVGDRNVADGYYNGDTSKVTKQTNVVYKDGEKGLPIFQGIDAIVRGDKATAQATAYFNQRWNSSAVRPVRLYNFAQDQLNLTYCDLKGEAPSQSCYIQVKSNIEAVKTEMRKLDIASERIKREKLIKFDEQLSWFKEGIETDDIEFLHDNVTEKSICEGKEAVNNIGARLYKAIDENTKHDLIVMTPYLVITAEMEALVKKLVSRGVKVKFISNSRASNDVPSSYAGFLKTRQKLLDLGVTIYEYEKLDTEANTIHTLHAKIVLMDTERKEDKGRAFIGSYNWDPRSQNLNSEVGVIVALDGKKAAPTFQLRNRTAEILRSATVTSKVGNVVVKSKYDEVQNATIKKMMTERESGIESWTRLLNNRLIGRFLEGQL